MKDFKSKHICYACGYDVEYLIKQLAEKDLKIERLKQDYDEVWEDTLFRVKEDFELNNNCNECRRYYAEEFDKQLNQDKISFAVEQLEKVKNIFGLINPKLDKVETIKEYIYYINNLINELKEGGL